MEQFEKKGLLELRKLSLDELKKYYVELRKYEFDNSVPLKGIKLRQNIHKLLLSIIKIDRVLAKEKLIIVDDKREKTDKPIIYACTHIGGNDIQRTFEAIKDHAYLFLGDPEGLYKDISGLLLYLNGVICMETGVKNDRYIAKERAIELLKNGGDLLIYPEGAWNITENLPVMKLYTGAIKMAMETNAEIIPIAIEQFDDTFYVNIGKNIEVNSNGSVKEQNLDLRDALATLKWEIWEGRGMQPRESINQSFVDNFKQSIVDKCEYGFTIDDVYATMYKDECDIVHEQVLPFIKPKSLSK